VSADELDLQVRGELRTLARPIGESVARRLVMAGQLLDEDPVLALEHAVAARRLASRIAVVREAVGIAAYHAGEWQIAIAEIRTYHRMTGKQTHLAILADCERAMGRPERAVDIYRSVDQKALDSAEAVELLIVAAGARRDMEQKDAAVAMLQIRELTADAPWAARLRYAYADALLEVGRRDEAREWFSRALEVDPDGDTDAAERLLDLDGILIEEDETDDPELALALAHGEMDDRAAAERDAGRAATNGLAQPGFIAPQGDDDDDDDDDDYDDEDDDLDDQDDDEDEDLDDDDDDDEDLEDDDDEDGELDDDESDDDDLDEDDSDDDLDEDEDDGNEGSSDDKSDDGDLDFEDYVPPSEVTVGETEPLSEPIEDIVRPPDTPAKNEPEA
jgi:tetratricopeptide (TPR) repeat protein